LQRARAHTWQRQGAPSACAAASTPRSLGRQAGRRRPHGQSCCQSAGRCPQPAGRASACACASGACAAHRPRGPASARACAAPTPARRRERAHSSLSRCGLSSPARASGCDSHRQLITRRFGRRSRAGYAQNSIACVRACVRALLPGLDRPRGNGHPKQGGVAGGRVPWSIGRRTTS
jgi:hypothetical protein